MKMRFNRYKEKHIVITRRLLVAASFCVVVALWAACCVLNSNPVKIARVAAPQEMRAEPQLAMEYVTRDSISTTEAGLADFPGSGTPTDPYVIAGYKIIANYTFGHCISIGNSGKHVLITNCYLILNDSLTSYIRGVHLLNA